MPIWRLWRLMKLRIKGHCCIIHRHTHTDTHILTHTHTHTHTYIHMSVCVCARECMSMCVCECVGVGVYYDCFSFAYDSSFLILINEKRETYVHQGGKRLCNIRYHSLSDCDDTSVTSRGKMTGNHRYIEFSFSLWYVIDLSDCTHPLSLCSSARTQYTLAILLTYVFRVNATHRIAGFIVRVHSSGSVLFWIQSFSIS